MSGFNGLVEQFASRSLANILGSEVDPNIALVDKMIQIELNKLPDPVKAHKAECDDCKNARSCEDLTDARAYRKELRRSIIPSRK